MDLKRWTTVSFEPRPSTPRRRVNLATVILRGRRHKRRADPTVSNPTFALYALFGVSVEGVLNSTITEDCRSSERLANYHQIRPSTSGRVRSAGFRPPRDLRLSSLEVRIDRGHQTGPTPSPTLPDGIAISIFCHLDRGHNRSSDRCRNLTSEAPPRPPSLSNGSPTASPVLDASDGADQGGYRAPRYPRRRTGSFEGSR
jgi:hypothetical protein